MTVLDHAPSVATTLHSGEIYRISPISLCYLADPATDELFFCTFGKFKGYRGQDEDDFGLVAGRPARFAVDDDKHIVWAELI